MTDRFKALLVHFLTATGAVLAMLAMLAAVEEKWDLMFVWLVVAFAVDGLDGPLARKYRVKYNAPQYDGVLMDLIIDYLTYVFIPAYALLDGLDRDHPDHIRFSHLFRRHTHEDQGQFLRRISRLLEHGGNRSVRAEA